MEEQSVLSSLEGDFIMREKLVKGVVLSSIPYITFFISLVITQFDPGGTGGGFESLGVIFLSFFVWIPTSIWSFLILREVRSMGLQNKRDFILFYIICILISPPLVVLAMALWFIFVPVLVYLLFKYLNKKSSSGNLVEKEK